MIIMFINFLWFVPVSVNASKLPLPVPFLIFRNIVFERRIVCTPYRYVHSSQYYYV
jgi:hypothetical protein